MGQIFQGAALVTPRTARLIALGFICLVFVLIAVVSERKGK